MAGVPTAWVDAAWIASSNCDFNASARICPWRRSRSCSTLSFRSLTKRRYSEECRLRMPSALRTRLVRDDWLEVELDDDGLRVRRRDRWLPAEPCGHRRGSLCYATHAGHQPTQSCLCHCELCPWLCSHPGVGTTSAQSSEQTCRLASAGRNGSMHEGWTADSQIGITPADAPK